MLHEFLAVHRSELIERCRSKVAQRPSPEVTLAEMEHGVPIFLEQLIDTLRLEHTAEPRLSPNIAGLPGTGRGTPQLSELGESATQHGRELLEQGFTVDQLVRDYGDLCQAITELALEKNIAIDVDEFHTLNRCLDNAISISVTEFNYQRNLVVADQQAQDLNQQLGFFAHELRNYLSTAMLALSLIKTGGVGLGGATGALLDRSLVGLQNLIDRSLAEVRATAEIAVQRQLFSLAQFITEIKLSASLEARVKECNFQVGAVDSRLAVEADRDLLAAALGNLLQNAFKFTHPHSTVTLSAYAVADRIRIDVEDHCGGLPAGVAETMFQPFAQSNEDRSGLGLGLSISQRSVEANHGTLSVRNIPGSGCVFTIDLPRYNSPETPSSSPLIS